jgi:hypothetical protein
MVSNLIIYFSVPSVAVTFTLQKQEGKFVVMEPFVTSTLQYVM